MTSLLSLPDELLLQAVGYIQLPSEVNGRRDAQKLATGVLRSCRRLHDISIQVLYSHPRIDGYHQTRQFVRTIRNIPRRASMVRTLFIDAEDYDKCRMPIISQLTIPILPRCVELYFRFDNGSAGILSFAEAMVWATQCPSIRLLRVNRLFDDAFVWSEDPEIYPSLDELGIEVPASLSTLYLEDFDLTAPSFLHFRALCAPWFEHWSSIAPSGPQNFGNQ